MAWYTLLVIGDDYQEQLEIYRGAYSDRKAAGLFFTDQEDLYRKSYETEAEERIRCEDGVLRSPNDEQFLVHERGRKISRPPAHLPRIEVRYVDLYKNFDDYMACRHKWLRDPDTRRYGWWENPRVKFDNYVIASDNGTPLFFPLKPNVTNETVPRPSDHGRIQDGYADQARKRDIDFAKMRQEYRRERLALYRKVHAIVNGRNIPSMCQSVVDHETASRDYVDHPVIRDLRLSLDTEIALANPPDFAMTEEDYLRRIEQLPFTTYALLRNGEWYERGMEGLPDNTRDIDPFDDALVKLIEVLPDETLLTLVLCHA